MTFSAVSDKDSVAAVADDALGNRPVLNPFADSSYGALRKVSFEFSDGALVLCGLVPSYHLKQIALHIARRHAGQMPIKDCIDVQYEPTCSSSRLE